MIFAGVRLPGYLAMSAERKVEGEAQEIQMVVARDRTVHGH